MSFTLNSLGQVSGVSTSYNGLTKTLASNITRKPFGPADTMQSGTGQPVVNQLDANGRVSVSNPGEPMEKSYTYDSNGNLLTISAPNAPWHAANYQYDALNRLIKVIGGAGVFFYSYDRTGNRLTEKVDGLTDTYGYETGTSRLTGITGANPATFALDANGNTVTYGWKTLTYNQNNRLTRVEENGTTIAEYQYNALEQRASKTVGGTTTVFHYDFSGNMLGESNTGGQFSTEYLYSGSSRIAMAKPSENKYYFFQNDHLGTPRTVIDENNVVVWEAMWRPFGEALPHEASTIVNNLRFPGQYYDEETGFHQNWHRDYDPSTGRYLEADPIGLRGGLNLYVYANGNPVMMEDPEGLRFFPPGFNDSIIGRHLGNEVGAIGNAARDFPRRIAEDVIVYGSNRCVKCAVKCFALVAIPDLFKSHIKEQMIKNTADEILRESLKKAVTFVGSFMKPITVFSMVFCEIGCVRVEE
jgi:RHS repeat-associated protein